MQKKKRNRRRTARVLTLAAAESFLAPILTRLERFEVATELARAAARERVALPPYDLAGLVQWLLEDFLSGLSAEEIALIEANERLSAEKRRASNALELERRCLPQYPDLGRIVKIVRRHRGYNDPGPKRPLPRR